MPDNLAHLVRLGEHPRQADRPSGPLMSTPWLHVGVLLGTDTPEETR